jgi:hypothetical protein
MKKWVLIVFSSVILSFLYGQNEEALTKGFWYMCKAPENEFKEGEILTFKKETIQCESGSFLYSWSFESNGQINYDYNIKDHSGLDGIYFVPHQWDITKQNEDFILNISGEKTIHKYLIITINDQNLEIKKLLSTQKDNQP